MKKVLFLIVTLVCISFGEAKADYSFSFMSNDGLYGISGTLITGVNGTGTIRVPGGSTVIGTGASNSGISYLSYYMPSPSIRPFGSTDIISQNELSQGPNPTFDLVFSTIDGSSYANVYGGPSSATILYIRGTSTPQHESFYYLSGGSVNVTPTPLPAAAWLFGSGLVGLAGLRRRQK